MKVSNESLTESEVVDKSEPNTLEKVAEIAKEYQKEFQQSEDKEI